MFKKILIANRGEIALRVQRTCWEMGIEPVAVYTPVDREALHVRWASQAYPLESPYGYLDVEEILAVARASGAQAIHPGYGFLAENPVLARRCQEEGIVFIGPDVATLELAGDKARARREAVAAGVPVVPGAEVEDAATAAQAASNLGYPLLVKAIAGGGGRGLRLVRNPGELKEAMHAANLEAMSAFGRPGVYLERFLPEPRHIEVQVLADRYGSVVTLGERECSVQRRHQKLVEESPSVIVGPQLREALSVAAVRVARAFGYTGAGTVEFLLAPDGQFYFIEVNARIQVEHPVTECVTGIDLVREQIRLAAGESLGYGQEAISLRGWAIECRLNAEDPTRNFMPSPGVITNYIPPGGYGVRVDSAAFSGCTIPSCYDSLFGKVIVWGRDRGEAIRRMQRALEEITVTGIATTIPFHRWAMASEAFQKGRLSTSFVDTYWLSGREVGKMA